MEMMFAHCPSNVDDVNIYDFLQSRKGERIIYLEAQLQNVFAMLAEDATDAMIKIKQALNFAQNLTGREKAVRDGVVSVLEAVNDEHVPLK